ncbi:MAG: hypothetical protein J6R54_04345, partial [Bacteroidaceae bacterium]|nr:hypothetical protein [Bacteroidaceae bacterium]
NTSSNSGLQMNIPTLRGVLETLPHMEFILFDACAMQSIEVAYELRNVTDYIIGSPTEIHAEGAPYDMILGPMMRGDVLEVVKQYYATYQSWDGVVISLLDCRKMEAFAQATAKVMPQFSEVIKTNGVEGVQIYQPYSSQTEWKPEPFDMEGAMYHTLDSASFAEWKTALDQILLYKNATSSWTSVFSGYSHCHLTDPDHYAALSIFLPTRNTLPKDGMRISEPSNGTALPVGTRPDGNPDKAPMAYPYKEPRHAKVPGFFVLYPACPPLSFVPLQKCKIAKDIVRH